MAEQMTLPLIGELAPTGKTSSPVSPTILDATAEKTNKPAAGWLIRVEYDPEKGYTNDDFMVRSDEYAKRFNVRPTMLNHGGDIYEPQLDAVLMEPVNAKEGNTWRWKPTLVQGMQQFAQFFESERGKQKHLRESFGDSMFGFDGSSSLPSATGLIDQEFIPIMAGPFFKQLYLYDYLYMHARAFELTNHNALAAAAIKIMQRFALGRGISFHIKHKQAREIWQEFWERNRMRDKLRQIARDLTWQGEVMLRFYDKPERGFISLRVLDPSTCWEVVTDPEDFEHVYYYHFQWPTPYQIWVSGQIPISRYIIQQIPPTNIQHLKINCSSQEKRGRSDLLPAMPWLKRFNDYYNGITVKAMLEANLVWKIKVKGDQADVDAFLTNPAMTQLPPPGGHWIENDAVDLQPISAKLTAGGARGSQGIGGQIAAVVATSMNLPPEYMNIEQGGAARATALVRTDPAVKSIEDRQQLLRELLEDLYDRVITAAILGGRISKDAAREEPQIKKGPMIPADAKPGDNGKVQTATQPKRRVVIR
jgi:hypothetical protein